jgi:pyrimidine operon attenuation protein/uracil phosphoribosyltransferase
MPPASQPQPTILLDARAMDRTLRRMADEIVELHAGTEDLVLVGIQRRGVQLAERLARLIAEREGEAPRRGALDITLYRDDLQTVGPRPVVGPTDIPGDIDNARVVIVDDVLYTGRTVRAALDELADFGRPARIGLAVLVDRGGRELPIHADVVGKRVDLGRDQRVDVMVAELDGRDAVVVVPKTAPPSDAGHAAGSPRTRKLASRTGRSAPGEASA